MEKNNNYALLEKKRKGGKKKKSPSTSIILCPGCRKPTLKREISAAGIFSHESYICEECGYQGAFYLEYDTEETGDKFIDLEELKKEFPDEVDPETEITLDEQTLQPQKFLQKDKTDMKKED